MPPSPSPLPLKVFSDVFKTINCCVVVFSCCSIILETHFGKVWRQSVAMVPRMTSYYGGGSLRVRPRVNLHAYFTVSVFSFFS